MKTHRQRRPEKLGENTVEELGKQNLELERRLVERAAELEVTQRRLDALSFSLSHQLRAPLRAMDGFSQILLEDFAPTLPEQIRHYLRTIQCEARRAGELIDDLLVSTRPEQPPATTSPTVASENEVLQRSQTES